MFGTLVCATCKSTGQFWCTLPTVLSFVQGRSLYVKLGDKDVEYNKNFKLILHTKLSNPHYPPEIQAETTLINFTVTESGLEDQLLALVVNKERPDLEETKTQLIIQNTDFTIKLKQVSYRNFVQCNACQSFRNNPSTQD